ncbi:MAG: hypothetical protein ACRDT4_03360 [Micromonosporaceae bacterium]
MEIDERVEPLVRKALNAAVKRDTDRLDAALKAFPDVEARQKGLELAMMIAIAALYDSYGGKPSLEQVGQVANLLSETEEWSGITAEDAFKYLRTVLAGESIAEAFDHEVAVPWTFVVTAALLSSSEQKREGEFWFNYLDRILMQLETAPSK